MFVVLDSRNRKIGRAAATYLPMRTCPETCPFRDGSCYAMGTQDLRRITKQLDALTWWMPLDTIIDLEAMEIEAVARTKNIGGLPLRLHVSGDVQTWKHSYRLGQAGCVWSAHGGGPVWVYTHAWAEMNRDHWSGGVQPWASVDSPDQIERARAMGYPSALVVPSFSKEVVKQANDNLWLLCPAQRNKRATCATCRRCFATEPGDVVVFAAHGSAGARRRAIETTRALTGEQRKLFEP